MEFDVLNLASLHYGTSRAQRCFSYERKQEVLEITREGMKRKKNVKTK